MTVSREKSEAPFAEFSCSEYADRFLRAQAAMQKRGIDAMLLTGKENIRYFAGGPLTELTIDYYNAFFLLLPADPSASPVLLMSCGREGAASTSWISDRRFWGYGETGSIMEQSESLVMVSKAISDRDLTSGVIATELEEGFRMGITLKEFRGLQSLLPEVEFVSAADAIWDVRSKKSPAEIDRIRRACQITCEAFEETLDELRPGITEKTLASLIRSKMFEAGATGAGFLSIFAGESRGMWADAMASDYKLQKGDFVMFDGGCCVDGYYADVSRMASVGEPKARNRELYELARSAQASALDSVCAGSSMRDVHVAGQRPIRERGFEDLLVFGSGQLGHGIGLTIHEPPDISATSEEPLEAGMTIAVEPAITDRPGWLNSTYFFIVENNVVVTHNGYEMLTPLSDELWIA